MCIEYTEGADALPLAAGDRHWAGARGARWGSALGGCATAGWGTAAREPDAFALPLLLVRFAEFDAGNWSKSDIKLCKTCIEAG